MRNGQGDHMLVLKEKNRQRVTAWVKDNPNGTMTECKNDLKLAYNTISAHLTAIRKGNDEPESCFNCEYEPVWSGDIKQGKCKVRGELIIFSEGNYNCQLWEKAE